MNSHTIAIIGAEVISSIDDPCSALVEFYLAFNQRKLAVMENNWSHSEEASMSNPLGGLKRGWAEIKAVYDRIFNGRASVYVEFFDYSIHQSGEMFCAIGKERGFIRAGDVEIPLAIRTSRIYRRENNRWKQLHHHGSIEDPALLTQYQTIVQKGKL